MNNYRIFLLIPVDNQNFPVFLIWADNEKDARENSRTTALAVGLGEQGNSAVTNEELKFYKNPLNASCNELKVENDYTIKNGSTDAELVIEYQREVYALEKNKAEEVKTL